MKINEFIQKAKELGINVTEKEIKLLEKYYDFLIDYNKHTNLTRITDKEEVYLKHFYDSLTSFIAADYNKITNVIDVGSGSGFPGIVLKIFFTNINLTIVDSNNKKTTFIKKLVEHLNLNNVTIINDRAENYAKYHLNEFDICISRAVAYVDIICELCLPFIKLDGKVILMKGDFIKEQKVLEKYYKKLNIDKFEIINCNLDDKNIRNLIVLYKKEETKNVKDYNYILKRNKKWKID